MVNDTYRPLVRITFPLDPQDSHGFTTERLWAESLGKGRYLLRNSPFYAFGVSNEDIVLCQENDEHVIFQRVLIRGGHSTYRLKPSNRSIHDTQFQEYWKPLEALGCTFEEGPMLSLDVPPTTDIYAVYALLEVGENSGIWEFEEGHCGHPLQER
jgi:hypothetical protein